MRLIAGGTVSNDAGATITATAGTNSAAVYGVAGALSITNAGTITGSRSIYSGGALTLDNSGTVTGFLATASGATLTIVNRVGGTIVSTAADGDLMYPVNSAVSILNAGTIRAAGFSATGNEGTGTGTITNAATGVLRGGSSATYGGAFDNAIQFGGAALTFNNYGSATSDSGNNAFYGTTGGIATINLFAGSTTGKIALGSGNDVLSIYSGQGAGAAATVDGATGITLQNAGTLAAASVGTVDFGGGTANLLQLRGVGDNGANGIGGSLAIGTITGANTITKLDGGIWTLTGVASGATAAARINAGAGGTAGNAGLLVFNATTGLTGAIYVNGGTIRSTATGSFGTGTIFLVDPTVQFTGTQTSANNYVLTVASPAISDVSVFQTVNAAATVTLIGTITSGTGNNVNAQAIDANQPVTFDGVAGSRFILSGANSWTGVTRVNSGITLQGTTASISGSSIVADGLLNYNQAIAGSSARAISGAGNVLIDGGGPVTLSGAITASGGVQIGQGTTAILSSVATSGVNAVTLTGNNATLQVASGGTIAGSAARGVTGTGQNSTVTNAGTIRTTGNFATVYFNANTGTNTVNNTGTIGGASPNNNSFGIYSGAGTVLNVTNSGTITSTNAPAIEGDGSGTLINSGTIQGGPSNSGVYYGAGATVTNNVGGSISGGFSAVVIAGGVGTVANYATITGGSSDAISLNGGGTATNYAGGTVTANTVGTAAIFVTGSATAIADNRGTINGQNGLATGQSGASAINSGTISVAAIGLWGYSGSIVATNSGTINAATGAGFTAGGSLTNTGTIAATSFGVNNAGGAATITNNGTISGGTAAIVSTGNFADTVTLGATSTTTGGVQLGAGADTLNLFIGAAVNGTLDGGADIDTLVIDGPGTQTVPLNTINFENLTKNGTGTLTLASGSFTAVTINAGTLNASGGNAIDDTAAVTVNSGGTFGLLASETIGTIAGAGNVSLAANTLTLAGNGSDDVLRRCIGQRRHHQAGQRYADPVGCQHLHRYAADRRRYRRLWREQRPCRHRRRRRRQRRDLRPQRFHRYDRHAGGRRQCPARGQHADAGGQCLDDFFGRGVGQRRDHQTGHRHADAVGG